jgi:SagB-type dehydrogenase family enzyme
MGFDRQFLKSDRWPEWEESETDQKKKVPLPQPEKAYPQDAPLINLLPPSEFKAGRMTLIDAISRRKSRRKYSPQPLCLEDLSFLLWSTQGLRREYQEGRPTYRNVPSGGARHPFETYLLINRVEGLQPGLYRYLPIEHKLLFIYNDENLVENIHAGCYEQYVKESAVVFIWTVIPYRTEWRYTFLSPKIIAIDAGHLCQNLYLACEAVNAGTCAIGAYLQETIDQALKVDGEEEFAIYIATVGKTLED